MTTNATPRRKKGGLGGLLAQPPEPVELTEGQEALDVPGASPAPTQPPTPAPADTPAPAPAAVPYIPPQESGFAPARPKRRGRVAKEKLTCAVPLSVFLALDELMERDGTQRQDEVTEALIAHLRGKGIQIQEG